MKYLHKKIKHALFKKKIKSYIQLINTLIKKNKTKKLRSF